MTSSCAVLCLSTEATLAATIRSELVANAYEPASSESCVGIGASHNGCATVQYRHHNKPADEEDSYMVMCGRKRSVVSPIPPELPPIPAKGNKEAIYAEIGNK